MNILSLFPAIPLLMMLGLWISRNRTQIHTVMVTGAYGTRRSTYTTPWA